MLLLPGIRALLGLGLVTFSIVQASPLEPTVGDILESRDVTSIVQKRASYPLHTSGRFIVDASNQRVKLRCVNWAGASETRIVEGLQMQALETITAWIAKAGFNCVRLTFSIDMAIDPEQTVRDSFISAANSTGAGELTSVYDTAVQKNPWLATSTTRGVFAKVIASLDTQGIMVVLDNHNSRASWCCGTADGNGWWDKAVGYNAANSRYFNTNNWLTGLSSMATFAKAYPNVVGLALRNELRAVSGQDGNNHADWYKFQTQAAQAISKANSELLIVIGGTNYGIDLSFLRTKPLDLTPLGLSSKVVWEFHSYSWSNSVATTDCTAYTKLLGEQSGFLLTEGKSYTGPLWLSEFGWSQATYSASDEKYYKCLIAYMETNDADWAYWALQGNYYYRGEVNFGETFGLLNDDWSGWRNASFVQTLGKMMQVSKGL